MEMGGGFGQGIGAGGGILAAQLWDIIPTGQSVKRFVDGGLGSLVRSVVGGKQEVERRR